MAIAPLMVLVRSDLRPQLNKAYGQKFMHTPAFDKFAGEALTFDYACKPAGCAREGSLCKHADPGALRRHELRDMLGLTQQLHDGTRPGQDPRLELHQR